MEVARSGSTRAMTELQHQDRCSANPPTFAARMLGRLGIQRDPHRWRYYRKRYKHTVFTCRECACGLQQVQCDGPMGDRSWIDQDQVTQSWTRRWLSKATRIDA